MSDIIKHECGIALLQLKKPLLSTDVANKVLYLASDESSNINGKIVKI